MAKKVSIEVMKKELTNRKVCLTLESDKNINNIRSPVKCQIDFDRVNINVIHPATIYLYGEGREVRLSQIQNIKKENRYGTLTYILTCGNLAQVNKDYVIECL